MKKNREIAQIFEEIADMLEIENIEWKPRAYRRAARGVKNAEGDVEEVYRKKGKKALEDLPGVGASMADHIIEYLESGHIEKFDELRKKIPEGLTELMDLEGLGPKRAITLSKELGVESMDDLKKALKDRKIRELPGFGEKTEENIKESLELYRRRQGRMLVSDALPIAEEIMTYMKENAPLERIDYVGSLRRMKETIGDIDVLVVSDEPEKVMDAFTSLPGIQKIISKGRTKSTIMLEERDTHVDLRVIERESYAAALQYFTGSKEHNIASREAAIKKGYKLSEYGLFQKKDNKKVPIEDEIALYEKLGFSFIAPELRENKGELDVAAEGKLPKLIGYSDLKGDLHMHSTYSDGAESIEAMVSAAEDHGYEYIAITDHSPSTRIAHGLDEKRLKEQWKEIDRLRDKHKIVILKGTEVDILPDGTLDYSDEILKEFDIVIGSIHSRFGMERDEMTKRIVKALENPYLTILGHPTGRKIGVREPYDVDLEAVYKAAKKLDKVLEINAQPGRLDLNDVSIFIAREHGMLFSIDSDAHSSGNLNYTRYGIGQARRGWLEKKDVINAKPWREFKKWLEERK